MSLESGTLIGPYRIETLLGEGGMGQVYRATDPRLGRTVAIKALPSGVSSDPGTSNRFDREARAVAALSHPHICALFDIGSHEGIKYLVMEYLEGVTLAERMESEAIPLKESLRLAAQISEAVHVAHTQGIIHRDLKPANIVITANGAKVLDFGLAKVLDADDSEISVEEQPTELVTRPHAVMGTAHYMSPEQARGLKLDHRTDIWSVGMILYEMLTGRRAFTGGTVSDIMAGVLRDEIDWSALPPNTPPVVCDLLKRLGDRDLEHRLDSLQDAAATLRAELVGDSSFQTANTDVPQGDDKSIVVLPFANSSPDPDNEYFSDGLTEEVIADLSNISSLRVISRTTAMRLKGMELDLKSIAARLSVRYVLEGSVRKAENNLRITSQLIDTRNDSTMWADKYSGTLDDVFEIQEQVSRSIVESLRLTLTPEEDKKLVVTPVNSYAYDVFLRARRAVWGWQKDELDRARRELEQALEVVGDDELLFRGLGMVNWQYVNSGHSSDLTYTDKAEEYARRILTMNPDSPHAAFLLGGIAVQRGDRYEWVRQVQRAVAGDPHDPDHQIWLAMGWIWAGYPDKAGPPLEKLESIDPLWELLHFGIGLRKYHLGQFEETVTCYLSCEKLKPGHAAWPLVTAQALASAGKIAEAVAHVDEFAMAPEENPLARLAHLLKFALLGDGDRVDELVNEEFRTIMWIDFHYSHMMAQVLALLNRREEGIKWLARSVERGYLHYPFLSTIDPLLENLRGESGFAELMADLKPRWEGFEAAVES